MPKKLPTSSIRVRVDAEDIYVQISPAMWAHYNEQFKTNTEAQRARRSTLLKLMAAAFRQGRSAGQSPSRHP